MSGWQAGRLFVQIMGKAMALTALRKVLVHHFRMGLAVTGNALRNHLMLLLVTGSARECGMFGRVALQLVQNIPMAAGAARGGGFGRIADLEGHMRFVTAQAILLGHFFAVWGMALHTVRDHTMLGTMAGGTAYLGMLAFVLLELGHLVGMAGETGLGKIGINTDDQGSVGIGMTR